MDSHFDYFATCARGLEPILEEELRKLRADHIEPGRGGVRFTGDRDLLYRANLWLRTAVRVLQPIREAKVFSPDELYEMVLSIDWAGYMTPEHTLAVDCNVRDSKITHSQYAARRVKDAICDQFRAKTGRRPSVDPKEPMVGLNLHIFKNRAVLSLDSSGMSLHKRGYRPILTKAPLNEALAAGLILHTGWSGDVPFVDPMCGSGTLPIEACWIAINRPPGLTRKRFGFQGWMDFDRGRWAELRDEARRGVLPRPPSEIAGMDLRKDAIMFAEKNARAAGVGHALTFRRSDIRHLSLPLSKAGRGSLGGSPLGIGPPGVIICNPPYGERIGEVRELASLYRAMGEVFRSRCSGWMCFVFTGNAKLLEEIGLPIRQRTAFFNGRIPCQLVRFEP